jgi:hypothetical protein
MPATHTPDTTNEMGSMKRCQPQSGKRNRSASPQATPYRRTQKIGAPIARFTEPVSNYQLSTATMTEHEMIYLAVLAVCEKQDGLCMDVEEERIRLAWAIADALSD